MNNLSVVIPFFNEEENVDPLFEELIPVLRGTSREFEVVAVDDGSVDGTAERLRQAASRFPEISVLRIIKNSGQTAAFEAGFRRARFRLVATMDGDLQIDPADLPRMVHQLETGGVDFVYGWRKSRRDPLLKRISTRIANRVRDWLTGESIPDTGCPLKVFKSEVVKRMKLFNGMHRFFITLAHMDGYRSSQMTVNHRPRRHGVSKYGLWNRLFRSLRDCFAVRWMMRRHLKYELAGESPAGGERVAHGSHSMDTSDGA